MLLAEFFKDDFRTSINEAATELSNIITACGLISQAFSDPEQFKHKYFEFLKYIREKHGEKYSTIIHRKAAKLAKEQE